LFILLTHGLINYILLLSGDNGEGDPPVPIPNTAVKPFSVDGTWTAGSWESRSLPVKKKELIKRDGFFLFNYDTTNIFEADNLMYLRPSIKTARYVWSWKREEINLNLML
jgi:hypothetical protein